MLRQGLKAGREHTSATSRPARFGVPLRQRHCSCSSSTQTAVSNAAGLKQRIIELSGSKYGHDLDAVARQKVEAAAKELEALPSRGPSLLTGSTWVPVYTTSQGTSSGKVGPFITEVVQEFPADSPGTYFNLSCLGPVCARLRGEYCVSASDRIDLEFKALSLGVGQWQVVLKEFAPGQMQGFWRGTYCDDDFRVFCTNMGNLFILRKV